MSLLEAVAARGRSLLLVGPASPSFDVGRLESLLSRPNVRWVGSKPFRSLPSYLRAIDVGLLPYGDTAFNRGSFPLKVLEYLAVGRAAVSTDLPAVRWLATDLIEVANKPSDFADAVDRALRIPRSQAVVSARRALASRHGWSIRAEEMAGAIGIHVSAPWCQRPGEQQIGSQPPALPVEPVPPDASHGAEGLADRGLAETG